VSISRAPSVGADCIRDDALADIHQVHPFGRPVASR
jgi:hypothetical protein